MVTTAPARDEIVDRHRGLVGRTALVSGLTLVSRILGFVREALQAALFGDRSGVLDAFYTAWRVPNLFRRFFGEGAISTSLQTALTEADGDGGPGAGRRLFVRTVWLTVGLTSALCVVGMALAALVPDTMPLTGWRWLGEDPAWVRELVVRLLPFLVVVCAAAIVAGALQVRGHFATPTLAPVAMNLVWIAALVWIGMRFVWGDAEPDAVAPPEPRQMDMARTLAWGALLSGVVQLLVQLPALARHGLAGGEAPPRSAGGPGAWDVVRTSLPLALGAAVYQINVMIDGFMAEGLLRDGGPAAHYLANRVQQFPLALIAIAAWSAVFPSLKALGHRGRRAELRALHDRAQLAVCFLALPAGVGLAVLAQPMASVLFEHGAYGPDGVARIAASLRALALALLPAGAVGLLARTYFALGDLRTPVRASSALLVANVGLNVAFVVGLGMDVEGLALATAVSAWLQVAWLLPGLRRRLGLPAGLPGVPRRIAAMAAASAAAGGAAWLAYAAGARAAAGAGPDLRELAGLAAGGAAGVGVYLGLAQLLGIAEWVEFRGRLARRLRSSGGGAARPGDDHNI